MSDLLLDIPWWLFLTLIVIGVALFWSGNNRQQKAPRNAGIALILLALLLKGVSFFVETDKEKCTLQTNELVKSVQDRNWPKFSSLLDDDVSLGTSMGSNSSNRQQLVQLAQHDCEQYNLTNVSASVTGIEQDAAGITIDITARSEQTATMGMAVPSSWKLIWDRTGKDWRLHEILCTSIGNQSTEEIGRLIGK
jgi:hypothetical protein